VLKDLEPIASRVAFVTGGASGIGAATARRLRASGWQIALMDVDAALLQRTATEIGGGTLALEGDVSNPSDCDAAVAQAAHHFGGIDLAWANAGVGGFGPLRAASLADWRRTIEINVFGTLHTARAALPHLIERRGQFAASASVASFGHLPAMSAYAASKAAVEAMCNAWRIEWAHHGVAVTAIHPLWIATPMVQRGAQSEAFGRLRRAMAGPMARDMPLEDAARRIADGLQRRTRRVFVPGWVRALFWMRPLLHTPLLERDLLAAAPELEALYAKDLQRLGPGAVGVAAASRRTGA
jgi:NAD(P)-dependent dehydrogenase (short-subunit alcohol dehydrogenase family)